jgi:cell division cycle protein 20 (cofactor of APC complex)
MSVKNNLNDAVELEGLLDYSAPVESAVPQRWERKAAAAAVTGTPSRKRARAAGTTPTASRGVDRFIPNRSSMDLELSHYRLTKETSGEDAENGGDANKADGAAAPDLKSALQEAAGAEKARVLAFKEKAPAPLDGYTNSLRVLYSQNKAVAPGAAAAAAKMRHIPSAPERILDAPELLDDYYLNLLDWSSADVIAVALGQVVYTWNAATGTIDELMALEGDDFVTSVNWCPDGGGYLAVGTNSACVQLWDATARRQVRSMAGHAARVGALSWNSHILTSGSRDATIVNHDVRIAQHAVATLEAHKQEVCGLKWSPDGGMLASGANDNLLCLWDARSGGALGSGTIAPTFTLGQHNAAVKALDWCPWQRHTLASGGGTADRSIKFWNTASGTMLNSIDTGSQVCSLQWNKHDKEILSSHGFSQNQLCLWKYPSMVNAKELTGHTARVLHMAQNPAGTMVCSAGADETLRFWNVFAAPSKADKAAGRRSAGTLSSSMMIR